MPLIDIDEDADLFRDLSQHCKPKDADFCEIRYDHEFYEAKSEWEVAYHNLKAAEYHADIAREKLIIAANCQNSKGFGVKIQKVVRKGAIDYAEIIKDLNLWIDIERYRKPESESWRITLDE
jgi:hypothetical protein